MRVHDAAHAAVDHVATQDILAATTNPAHPDYTAITGQVLRDPRLGSRTTQGVNVPSASPVGSASVYQNPGGGAIPPAVQAAISNLNTSQSNSTLQQILNRVLGGTTQGQQAPATQAQNDYYQTQADLNRTQNQILQAPGQIAGQIKAAEAANPPRLGIMSLNPTPPGMYNPAANNALQDLYGQQATAKQAASGWTANANAAWNF